MSEQEFWPRILVFSEGTISRRHGTGAIFARNFSNYPQPLLANAFISDSREPWIEKVIDLNLARWPKSPLAQLRSIPARIFNRMGGAQHRAVPVDQAAIAAMLQDIETPDLIYGICYGSEGIITLQAVVDIFPTTPLLLHFHDFWPSVTVAFDSLLRRLVNRSQEIWTVSDSIAVYIFQRTGRACTVDPGLYGHLPLEFKREHAPYRAGFRTVIFGNIWNNSLFEDLKTLWQTVRREVPEVGPLQWYCHPDAVANHRAAGRVPEPELVHAGFLQGEAITQSLISADLALIPFSRDAQATSDYERFSMPSRLTELITHGVPLFGIASRDTPLATYMAKNDLGPVAPACATEDTAQALLALIKDRHRREVLGHKGRQLAERELDLSRFQPDLYSRLAAIAGKPSAV